MPLPTTHYGFDSIMESATNLRFLAIANEQEVYEQFVHSSLGPEWELYDLIQKNIQARKKNKVLPIEKRMLNSIDRVLKASGMNVQDINPKFRDWGGGLRNRLKAIGAEERYLTIQRIPSHAVHGSWVDIVQHHIKTSKEGFAPDPSWSRADARLLLPPCTVVLEGLEAYLDRFVGRIVPEIKPLYGRIYSLNHRIEKVDRAHEIWLR